MERYFYGSPGISNEQLKASQEVGILCNERDIVEQEYLMSAKAFKETKGTMNLSHRSASDYSDDIWMGLGIEEYCKKYPVRFDVDKGIWHNS